MKVTGQFGDPIWVQNWVNRKSESGGSQNQEVTGQEQTDIEFEDKSYNLYGQSFILPLFGQPNFNK